LEKIGNLEYDYVNGDVSKRKRRMKGEIIEKG